MTEFNTHTHTLIQHHTHTHTHTYTDTHTHTHTHTYIYTIYILYIIIYIYNIYINLVILIHTPPITFISCQGSSISCLGRILGISRNSFVPDYEIILSVVSLDIEERSIKRQMHWASLVVGRKREFLKGGKSWKTSLA